MDVTTRGPSTGIFLCIGPFSAWWHRTNNQVILVQACSWPVRRQSFAIVHIASDYWDHPPENNDMAGCGVLASQDPHVIARGNDSDLKTLIKHLFFKKTSHYPPPFVGHRYKDHWPPPFEGFDQPQKANWLSKAGTYEFVLEGLHNFQSCRHIWTKETVKRKGKNKIAQCKRKSHWLIWSQIYTIFTSCTDGLCQMNSLLVKKLWHRQGPLHLKTIYYQHHCVAVFTYLKFKTHYSNESESFNDLMTLRTWLSLTMTHQISLQCWYQR